MNKVIMFRLDNSLHERLKFACGVLSMNMSDFIRQAVEDKLEATVKSKEYEWRKKELGMMGM